MTIPALMVACGGEDKKDDKSGMSEKEKCECLHANMEDQSKECIQYEQEVYTSIKKDLNIDPESADLSKADMDAIKQEMESIKAKCN